MDEPLPPALRNCRPASRGFPDPSAARKSVEHCPHGWLQTAPGRMRVPRLPSADRSRPPAFWPEHIGSLTHRRLLTRENDIAPIPGTRRVSRVRQSKPADGIELTGDQLARLSGAVCGRRLHDESSVASIDG